MQSPAAESEVTHRDTGQRWVKAFGIPLHAWTTENFKKIGDQCGRICRLIKTQRTGINFIGLASVYSKMEFPMKVVAALQYQSILH